MFFFGGVGVKGDSVSLLVCFVGDEVLPIAVLGIYDEINKNGVVSGKT